MRKLIFLILAFSCGLTVAQSPQVSLTGNIGAGGVFPLINSPAVAFATDADHTMVYPEMSGSSGFILVTSSVSLSVTRKLIAPLIKGFIFTIENATTGAQSIQVIGTTGSGVTIGPGATAIVSCDGTNYINISISGLGTMAFQNANGVAITGGTILNTPIGTTTTMQAAGNFSILQVGNLNLTSSISGTTSVLEGLNISGVPTWILANQTGAATFPSMTTPSATISGGAITGTTVGSATAGQALGGFSSLYVGNSAASTYYLEATPLQLEGVNHLGVVSWAVNNDTGNFGIDGLNANAMGMQSTSTATSSNNNNSGTFTFFGSYYSAGALQDEWNCFDALGTGTSPTSKLQCNHFGSPGPASFAIPAITVGTSQVLAGVQGTTGTNFAAATGTFTNGNLRKTDSNGNEIDAAMNLILATGSGCSLAASSLSQCSTTVSLATAEPSTAYSVVGCTATGTTNSVLLGSVGSLTTTSFSVTETNSTTSANSGGTITCLVVGP